MHDRGHGEAGASGEMSRAYVIVSIGSRISFNVLQDFGLEENIVSNHTFSASLDLFHLSACFAYSWAFLSQEIQTRVVCSCEEMKAALSFLTFHCFHSLSKLPPACCYRGHLECRYHFASGSVTTRKTGTRIATGVHHREHWWKW